MVLLGKNNVNCLKNNPSNSTLSCIEIKDQKYKTRSFLDEMI